MSSSRARALPSPVRPIPGRALRTGAVVAAAALVLGACGDDAADEAGGAGEAGEASSALDEIEVEGGFGEEPTITFDEPFALEESASETLVVGDGEEIETGDTVVIDYSIVSGTDGTSLDSSFGAATINLPLVEGQTTPALVDAVVGETVGSRVLVAVAPEPTDGASAPEAAGGDPATDTIVFVLDLVDVVPERAEGEPVEQPEGTPVVETDEEGDVTGLDVSGVTAPEELVVTPVIQGDGEEVQAGDTVTIHYTGVLASDGTEFDSSWSRDEPATFPLGNLIQGWQEGLVGVPVGSRVLLQVPSELAYGAEGSPPTIPGDADLVFVIDVLATQSAPEAPSPEPSE